MINNIPLSHSSAPSVSPPVQNNKYFVIYLLIMAVTAATAATLALTLSQFRWVIITGGGTLLLAESLIFWLVLQKASVHCPGSKEKQLEHRYETFLHHLSSEGFPLIFSWHSDKFESLKNALKGQLKGTIVEYPQNKCFHHFMTSATDNEEHQHNAALLRKQGFHLQPGQNKSFQREGSQAKLARLREKFAPYGNAVRFSLDEGAVIHVDWDWKEGLKVLGQ